MTENTSFRYLESAPYLDDSESLKAHTIDIWESKLPVNQEETSEYWVVFIHGGAWRDPEITSSFAVAAVATLQKSTRGSAIGGFASINYRLSSHPYHPTSPSHAEDPARNAIHPDHLCDVQHGIDYLQKRFQFGSRYILVGHSCGATLAFQTISNQLHSIGRPMDKTVPPCAIVGMAGIYDLVLLRDSDPHPPTCQEFLSRAFSSDEEVWRTQSPVDNDYEATWSEGRVVVLLKCSEDEYVSPNQLTAMEKALKRWRERKGRVLACHTVSGRHDDCWKMGHGLAHGVEKALDYLVANLNAG